MPEVQPADISEKIKEFIAECFEIPLSEVQDNTNLIYDLGADSLDVTELILKIEDEFGIEIDEDNDFGQSTQELVSMPAPDLTVGQLIQIIEAKKA